MKRQTVFRPQEITDLTSQLFALDQPFKEETVEEESVFEGPSLHDVLAEIASQKRQWRIEKTTQEKLLLEERQTMLREMETERTRQLEETQKEIVLKREESDAAIEQIRRGVEAEAEAVVAKAKREVDEITQAAEKEGFKEGFNKGFEEGKTEADRLISRIHSILNGIADRRIEIMESLEPQLIDMTLLIAKKVIKILSENQKNIIIHNALEALKKLKTRSNVVIRLNTDDLDVMSERKQDFIEEVEKLEGLTLIEDGTVDRGGCVIETDYGEIDARISSQLREVEDRILELRPVKKRAPGLIESTED